MILLDYFFVYIFFLYTLQLFFVTSFMTCKIQFMSFVPNILVQPRFNLRGKKMREAWKILKLQIKKKLVLLFPNSLFKNKFLPHTETFQSENWHE